ncbi:MAG: acyl-CoA dehydrogenase family protein [Candidatus Brocadiae bacterium]|nr:acyl-CoA dehydrogenase family protein [Candidatus Brocadiia bacterium]
MLKKTNSIYRADYLNLIKNFTTHEQQEVLNTFLKFSQKNLPLIEKCAWERHCDPKLWAEMAELGCFGAHIPEKYSGTGLDEISYALMMIGLEWGDSSLRSNASVQNALVAYPILSYGSEEQRVKYLPKLATGEWIGAFGLTEPNHGSDPGSLETKAMETEGGYILSGSKQWITNANIADIHVVWAKLNGMIHGFLVEKGRLGLTAVSMSKKDSLQAGHTGEYTLDEVFIPKENLLPESAGLKCALKCLNEARAGIAAGIIGAAMFCYETAWDYVMERKQFGIALAGKQIIQVKLADMATAIAQGLSTSLHLAELRERKAADFSHVSMLKRANTKIAREVASTAREMLGANGVSSEYPIMRVLKNIESVYTYEGTYDVHGLIIGNKITGIPAY